MTEAANEIYFLVNPHIEEFAPNWPEYLVNYDVRSGSHDKATAFLRPTDRSDKVFVPNEVEIHVSDPIEYYVFCNAMGDLYGEPVGFNMVLSEQLEPRLIERRQVLDVGSVEWLARLRATETPSTVTKLTADELPDI